MKKYSKQLARLVLLTSLVFGGLFIFQQQTSAASTITASGITVSPAIINLNLNKDQATNSFDTSLTNNTNQAISLTVSSLDFKSLNDTGGLTFIGSSAADASRKHSLAAWITTPTDAVVIGAKQTVKVPIIIDNRSDLSPGGHYAAVLYSISAPDTSAGSVKVNVNQVASTLVFVTKTDGANYGLELNKFRVRFSWWHIPRTIDLSFLNSGNSQTVPRGLITVSTSSGNEVSRGQINTNSSILLPDNTRVYSTPLLKTGSAIWPGVYKVYVTYHSDDISQIKTADVNFTYINLLGIIELIVAIIVIKKFGRKVIHSVVKKTRKQVKKVSKKLR